MKTISSVIQALAAALILPLAMRCQTLNTIYSFGHNELGYKPTGGVVVGLDRALYGTTPDGGASGLGVVYKLVPPSSPGGEWAQVVIHSFSTSDGDGPPTMGVGLAVGSSGVVYGVTTYNDVGDYGTVFELKPPAGAGSPWRESVLHGFTEMNGDGLDPATTPIFGPQSVLYGATSLGGTIGSGTIYELIPPGPQGGSWTEQILHSFDPFSGDGAEPAGALAVDSNGAIYGTTEGGGPYVFGVAFQLAPPAAAGGSWTETLLHSFGSYTNPHDPGIPNGLVLGAGGVLYGTTEGSSGGCPEPCGSVFELTPPQAPGGAWTETILHYFTGGDHTTDGTQPNSTPVLGSNGELYGTTRGGGRHDGGTIYEMVPPAATGGSWTEIILYSFTNLADGGIPNAVTLGPDGNLYGTTAFGGVSKDGATNQGTVFQLVLQ
jgi:uncharacterized repeat protein (TIGR03803 family)